MTEEVKTRGWVDGEKAITYQRCIACGHCWYFWRSFCPECGEVEPESLRASGSGRVHAVSMVHRAPLQELRAHAPYLIVLIDADEGFRLMAHGESSLKIGDRVRAGFIEFGSRVIPCFEKVDESD